MTGIAPSRVTTNSQAIASQGGLLVGGLRVNASYGNTRLKPDNPGGESTSTCATQNDPSELKEIEHCADRGGAFPLGGLICPSTGTPTV
jgi:hypothetical protein